MSNDHMTRVGPRLHLPDTQSMLQFSKSYTARRHAVKSTANPNARVEPNRAYGRRVLCLRAGPNVVCGRARADRSTRPVAGFALRGGSRGARCRKLWGTFSREFLGLWQRSAAQNTRRHVVSVPAKRLVVPVDGSREKVPRKAPRQACPKVNELSVPLTVTRHATPPTTPLAWPCQRPGAACNKPALTWASVCTGPRCNGTRALRK